MIRVLVIDDSAVVRQVLRLQLGDDPEIEVIGEAPDPYVARDLIVEHHPDVLTLDIEMPRMDGLTFLRKLMHYHPMPVVVVSSLTPKSSRMALDALEAGAVDVVCKPGAAYSVGSLVDDLKSKLRIAAAAKVKRIVQPDTRRTRRVQLAALEATTNAVLAIASSTGGTTALETILTEMPPDAPGTIVTQHMPEVFTSSFARRLDGVCAVDVKEAESGDSVVPGRVLIARGDHHLLLRRNGARYVTEVKKGPYVNNHRPSADVMFRSVAKVAGRNAIGVILTGMGKDGAQGLLDMKSAGGRTIAQDEATSIVYGMPKAAVEIGAAEFIESLSEIAGRVVRLAVART